MSTLRQKWLELEAKSITIIGEDERKKIINSFFLRGFHRKIFTRVIIHASKPAINYSKHLKKNYQKHQLFQEIKYSHKCLTASFNFSGNNVTLVSQIPRGLPIQRCDQFASFYCCSHGLLLPHQLCYHFILLFSMILDTSPTTNDLIVKISDSFSENKNYIKFGKNVFFDKKLHNIPSSFNCSKMLNNVHTSLVCFSKLQSNCYIYIFLYFINALNRQPQCDKCTPEWNPKVMKHRHICSGKFINPFKTCDNLLLSEWNITSVRNMILFSCAVGLHSAWTEIAKICGFGDHTAGQYFMYFASICEIDLELNPVKILNEAAHDVAYDGQGKRGQDNRKIKKYNQTNLSRVMEIQYNNKQGHKRRTTCIQYESTKEVLPMLKETLPNKNKLYLDGCAQSRARIFEILFNVGNCNHLKKKWVRQDTAKFNLLNVINVQVIEKSWTDDRLFKRIRRGAGPRTGDAGVFNRQMYQHMYDWIHNKTDRTPEDIAKIFWSRVVDIFQIL
eukprot:1784_1